MTTEIGDIIFGTKSTLYEVLDELQVPELAGEVTSIGNQLLATQDQLRQLGVIVDSNQSSNNEQFLLVNTRVDNIELQQTEDHSSIVALQTLTDQFSQNFVNIFVELGNLTNQIDTLSTQLSALVITVQDVQTIQSQQADLITALQLTTTTQGSQIASQGARIDAQQIQIDSLLTFQTNQMTLNNSTVTQLAYLNGQVNLIDAQFASIPIDLNTLYQRCAVVTWNTLYYVYVRTSNTRYTMFFYPTASGDRPVTGATTQRGSLAGSDIAYLSFVVTENGVTWSGGASIPLGAQLRMRYGTSSSSYTTVDNVVITPYY